jgi:DNA helicase-2/ATP-dependent DNA helicase PcrA
MGSMDELAEERRLAYVGITRARERLYLTRAAMRSAWGTSNALPESRFMSDIPDEVIDWQRRESATDALRQSAWGGSFTSTWASPVVRWKSETTSAPPQKKYREAAKEPARSSAKPHPASSYAPPPAAPAYESQFSIGDRVSHDSYGLGKVVALEGAGHNAVARVDFGTTGTKRLVLRFAPLTKL